MFFVQFFCLKPAKKQRIITMAEKQVFSVTKVDKFRRLGLRTPMTAYFYHSRRRMRFIFGWFTVLLTASHAAHRQFHQGKSLIEAGTSHKGVLENGTGKGCACTGKGQQKCLD